MGARLSILGVSVALVAGVAAASFASSTASPIVLPVSHVRFATFSAVPLRTGSPAYARRATPRSLSGVRVVKTIRAELQKAGATRTLTRQGFVVVPSDLRFFHDAYEGNVYEGWPVFVTTDVAYHEWHQVFDKILRDLEQNTLLPKLETLVSGLVRAAHAQTVELAGTSLAGPAGKVEQLLQVAAAELGLPVKPGPLAAREKALVDAHNASATSPLLGTRIDYSLFKPRGHYTYTARLKRYFTAMSVLGQSAFCLPGTRDCSGIGPARLGILASRVLTSDRALVSLWRKLYEPTAFLVGLADDYTPLEVAAAASAVVKTGLTNARAFSSDSTVQAVLRRLVAARKVAINPDRASIRIMGTRFVIDSFVLDQLIYPNVGTEQKPRLFPTPLDLAAAFGSDFAYGILKQTGQTTYAGYDGQLQALRKAVAERPAPAWGSTVYDAWLYALEPMFLAHGTAFPDFMRSDAWRAKDQQTGLGSYAELKHDTVLYAKQAVAEGGDTGIPARRNWVEPDPVAFGRLAAVADLLRSGLSSRGLLTKSQARLLGDVIALDRFFQRIARDELAGKPISKADNTRLTYLGGELEALWFRTSNLVKRGFPIDPAQDALVADIASSAKGVLEIGTGRIDRIYVLVPDDRGTFQVAVGGVYSYYEFKTKPGMRLTDDEWHAMIDAGKAPKRPAWEGVLFPGS